MRIVPADHERRIDVPGVPGPARRPVDIDQSLTGFRQLRSLRIYRFEAGSTVQGHAEEDEVFVVLLSGSARFTVSGPQQHQADLAAPETGSDGPCASYLAPECAYQLVAHADADVAYARVRPKGEPRRVASFAAGAASRGEGIVTLLDQTSHAELLKLRLMRIGPHEQRIDVPLFADGERGGEAIVHLRTQPAAGVASIVTRDGAGGDIRDWHSGIVTLAECPVIEVGPGAVATVLMVWV